MRDKAVGTNGNEIRIRNDTVHRVMFDGTDQNSVGVGPAQCHVDSFGRTAREQQLTVPVECRFDTVATVFERRPRGTALGVGRGRIGPARKAIDDGGACGR